MEGHGCVCFINGWLRTGLGPRLPTGPGHHCPFLTGHQDRETVLRTDNTEIRSSGPGIPLRISWQGAMKSLGKANQGQRGRATNPPAHPIANDASGYAGEERVVIETCQLPTRFLISDKIGWKSFQKLYWNLDMNRTCFWDPLHQKQETVGSTGLAEVHDC